MWLIDRIAEREGMARQAPRTRAQTLSDLEERRRLAALDHNESEARLWCLDRAIGLLRSGKPLKACSLEDIDPEAEAS